MSRGFSSILKTVAMIAVPFVAAVAAPFVAPLIGGALGAVGLSGIGTALGLGGAGVAASTLGTGLTGAALGAGLGAATGAATGRGALMGAITGGLGGGLGGAAQIGSALGLAPTVASAPLNLPGSILAGTANAAGAMAPTAGALGAGAGAIGTGTVAAAGAASPLLSKTIDSLIGKFVQGINPGGIADLAMTMYNKPPEGLTDEEKKVVAETAQLAQTNQDLFKQRVEQANAVWQSAQANPEKAYAEAQTGVQRALREQQRRYGTGSFGGTGSQARQAQLGRTAAIEGAKAGASAASAETERSDREKLAAAGMLPTSAPVSAGMATMPIYQAAEKRQMDYSNQLARATGSMFGGIYNPNQRGLYVPQYS